MKKVRRETVASRESVHELALGHLKESERGTYCAMLEDNSAFKERSDAADWLASLGHTGLASSVRRREWTL